MYVGLQTRAQDRYRAAPPNTPPSSKLQWEQQVHVPIIPPLLTHSFVFFSVTTCPFPFASACTSHVAFIDFSLNRVPQTRPLSCFFGSLLRLRPHLRQQLSFPHKLERRWRLRVTCRHHLSQPTARVLGAAAVIDACGPAVDWEMLTCEG